MTAANANTAWATAIAEELVATGIETVCVAPGSRSTPLTLACADHDDLTIYSILDERSMGYFAIGHSRFTGSPTPVITTSGTATANLHPAVMEADQGRVPLLVLTADRPPERQDSGANQTVDQTTLYGDAVRWFHSLGLPDDDSRAMRALRTTIGRAVATAVDEPAGPVHLNFPFRKPLAPQADTDRPTTPSPNNDHPDGSVSTVHGDRTLSQPQLSDVAATLSDSTRPLIVCGPMPPYRDSSAPITSLGTALNAPILADPLSGIRFGAHVADSPVIGQYDAYLTDTIADDWPSPDVVVRFGASPTSKRLRQYLADADAIQFLVDPAGGWREAEFTATDHLIADPGTTAADLADVVKGSGGVDWVEKWVSADTVAANQIAATPSFEGSILATVVDAITDGAVLFVSNSTPIRDLDRYCPPSTKTIHAVGNRGASGIDGITSTALGAGAATESDLVLVTGDLAFYHDMNGLLALDRCDVDATIVLINNDGGGIFYRLPISEYDPVFTDQFRTPHGLEFEPVADLYGLEYTHAGDESHLQDLVRTSVDTAGTQLIEMRTDGESSQQRREAITDELITRLASGDTDS